VDIWIFVITSSVARLPPQFRNKVLPAVTGQAERCFESVLGLELAK